VLSELTEDRMLRVFPICSGQWIANGLDGIEERR
jgi:hypothetical protein